MENEILARGTTSPRPPSLRSELCRQEVPERVPKLVVATAREEPVHRPRDLLLRQEPLAHAATAAVSRVQRLGSSAEKVACKLSRAAAIINAILRRV